MIASVVKHQCRQNSAYRSLRLLFIDTMKLPEDPIILELLPDFVLSWTKDIETRLEEFAKAENEYELYRFGHTLKGSSRQFGVEHLSEYGSKIQECAKTHQWAAAAELKNEILQSLQELKLNLETQGLLPAQQKQDLPSNL